MLADGVVAAIGAAMEPGLLAEVGCVAGSCCAHIARGPANAAEAIASRHTAGVNFHSPATRAVIRSKLIV